MAKAIIAKYKCNFASPEEKQQFLDEQKTIIGALHPGAIIEFVDQNKKGAPKIVDRLRGRYQKAETINC